MPDEYWSMTRERPKTPSALTMRETSPAVPLSGVALRALPVESADTVVAAVSAEISSPKCQTPV